MNQRCLNHVIIPRIYKENYIYLISAVFTRILFQKIKTNKSFSVMNSFACPRQPSHVFFATCLDYIVSC
jgi:hypothetical protein